MPLRCARLSRRPLPFAANSGRIMARLTAAPALRLAALEIGPQRGFQAVLPAIGLAFRHVPRQPSFRDHIAASQKRHNRLSIARLINKGAGGGMIVPAALPVR